MKQKNQNYGNTPHPTLSVLDLIAFQNGLTLNSERELKIAQQILMRSIAYN